MEEKASHGGRAQGGAAIFLSDLARSIQADATFDFVAVSSYGKGQRSSGAVKLIKDLDEPIEGKNVLIVEDILDTGLYPRLPAQRSFSSTTPKPCASPPCLTSPRAASSTSKPTTPASPSPNLFVIGYGMDYAERYRNLPDICLMSPDHPE